MNTKLRMLKDFFTSESSQKCGEAFGDPAWLKARRQAGFDYWAKNIGNSDSSGSRFMSEMHTVSLRGMDTGEKRSLAQKYTLPDLAWGELAGSYAYGCEDEGKVILSDEALRKGVRFLSLKDAIRQFGAEIEKLLFSTTALEETRYTALHAAYFGQGFYLHVPKGIKLEKPIVVKGVHTGGHAGLFPHSLVVLEEGAQATVIEEFHSATDKAGLVSGISELIAAPSARLSYVSFQKLNDKSIASLRQSTHLSRDSYLYTLGIVTGGDLHSSYMGSTLEGENGRVDLLGLILGKRKQQIEFRTLQDHRGRAGESDALVKSILRGSARSYFDGRVQIPKSGQQSNAFQSNPNLLLSSEARAESIPTLEIEADDVACKHAASIGSIDEDERFYLLSRGIPLEDTEAMIVEGFAAELAHRLPDADLQERFEEILNGLTKEHAASN